MTIQRANVSFAQQIAIDRVGNPYVYGGNWDPFNRATGTDCSGCVVDELDAAINGTAMAWSRHGLSTENWRSVAMGGSADPVNGPFGTIQATGPGGVPADAAVKIALHHGDGGGVNSHMWCQVDQLRIETNGDNGTVLGSDALAIDDLYANDWWFLPGPIAEDGTPVPTAPSAAPSDTLFADVSEFQPQVDDSYPFSVLSIRVCDGTYQDHNFAANYAWMRAALDSGKLAFGIVYTYVRPASPSANAATVKATIDANGGLHPRVVLMLDVEAGGNPGGDQSDPINQVHDDLADYAGSPARIIGYGNVSDLDNLWPEKPDGIRLIVAGYGSNPDYPGKIAHQYTNGTGYGGGLPEGCSPFCNCDMNSADGLDSNAFAAACGIGTPPAPTPGGTVEPLTADEQQELLTRVREIWDQLRGPGGAGWSELGERADGNGNRTPVDAMAHLIGNEEA